MQTDKPIWSRKGLLKGSNYFINENFSEETESKRRQLYPILKVARYLPEYKDKVFIQVDRLVLNGQSYTVDKLDRLPSKIQPAKLATQENDTMIKFFRKASPLSNFHPSPIKIDGMNYNCVEQYYQSCKATAFNDDVSASQIMAASEPHTCYSVGQSIKDFKEEIWRQSCDKVMERGLLAKFSSSQKLKSCLLQTEDKILAECNGRDEYWGVGLYSNNKLSDNPDTWKGQNKLGTLLMKVRSTLHSQS